MSAKAKYDDDFFLWSQEQAAALREAAKARPNLPIDFEHVAEEIEDLGRSNKTAIRSLCAKVIEHRLKLDVSPAIDPRRRWEDEIGTFRMRIIAIVEDSPSLRPLLPELAERAWKLGRSRAIVALGKDGIFDREIPKDCPYSAREILGEVLDYDW